MRKRVRYTGPGGEVFYEHNWAPKPGEVREIDLTDDADLEGHPSLEETTDPMTLQTETEIAAGTAEDPEEKEDEDEKPRRSR